MIVIDTSALFSLADRADVNHGRSKLFYEAVVGREELALSGPVLTEAWSLAKVRLGHAPANRIWETATGGVFRLFPADELLLEEALQIERKYADCRFGLVDSVCFALCEKLKTSRVFTFDRRHFSAYVPSFAPRLELLP